MGEDAGLARSSTGDDQQRTIDMEHSIFLCGIETRRQLGGHNLEPYRTPVRLGSVSSSWLQTACRQDERGKESHIRHDIDPRPGSQRSKTVDHEPDADRHHDDVFEECRVLRQEHIDDHPVQEAPGDHDTSQDRGQQLGFARDRATVITDTINWYLAAYGDAVE